MKKASLITSIFFTLFAIFFLWIFKSSSLVNADAQCGNGWTCWPSNGGSAAVFAGCTYQGTYPNGYCKGTGGTTRYCSCDGSADCSCEIPGGATCTAGGQVGVVNCSCYSSDPNLDGDWCGSSMASDGEPCYDQWGPYDSGGTCGCFDSVATDCVLTGAQTIGCCYQDSTTPTPNPTPTPTPGGGGGTPTPSSGPTPYFTGNVYLDANAIPGGIGGTDNLCVGDTSTLLSTNGGTASISRSGENKAKVLTGASYTINANTFNNDYTVTLDLPFPPADPDNPLQCACNADPVDPYRCVYTNQEPSQGLTNFFVKYGNTTGAAWFQTLGGSSWASGNIESQIPASTCTPPTCVPALIGRDIEGTTDSAGFPLSNTGAIVTSSTGDNYIHETDGRSNAIQANALGVNVPIENYDYFLDKFGDQAQTLPNAGKPIVGGNLAIYSYTGNLTLDETNPWNLTSTEKIIVFVNGNLTINDSVAGENRITSVAKGGDAFLMFIVNGGITITSNVGYADIYTDASQENIANVEGIFVADDILTIERAAGTTDRKFIGAGTFVGWSGVDLQRNFDDGANPDLNNNAATEVFVFRPDLIINAPREIKSAQMTWREVEPRF